MFFQLLVFSWVSCIIPFQFPSAFIYPIEIGGDPDRLNTQVESGPHCLQEIISMQENLRLCRNGIIKTNIK